MSHSSDPLDLAEIQLERELRQMFELDSQKDLETYLACARDISPESWVADIQKMYRAIHTIKGSSVTVKADSILAIATVLEDLLSGLRYLEEIPFWEDGQFREILQEGGEIIAGVLSNPEGDVQPKVERIQALQQIIQQNYLQDWSEQTQVQIEFAEQGFDLVGLELEIALKDLPEVGIVPEETVHLATELISNLHEIGQDLAFDNGWYALLERAASLLGQLDSRLWKNEWPQYFDFLKTSAKQGGKLVAFEAGADGVTNDAAASAIISEDIIEKDSVGVTDFLDLGGLESFGNLESFDDHQAGSDSKLREEEALLSLGEIHNLLGNFGSSEFVPEKCLAEADVEVEGEKTAQVLELETELETKLISERSPTPKLTSKLTSKLTNEIPHHIEDVQVPSSLIKLEKSSQLAVNALISARTMESFYDGLHQEVLSLVDLATENARYISQLRQIQDDYALSGSLDLGQENSVPNAQTTPERYRKGYATINRLLENSLRLSEIGTEAKQTLQQTSAKIANLRSYIIDLKDAVEASRLIPFKNLAFRVKAILRDLSSRYDKNVSLNIQGEQIKLDVGTSRKLEPILLHLVRNAFDHGLESSEERTRQSKSERGEINLSLQRYGSSYVLSLRDDGRGIDAEKIRAKAERLDFPLTRTDTSQELLSVLCQPGFSSQSQVSDVSGRGVGMDVVAEQIYLLNGSLALETEISLGTTFKLNFPVPHLLVPCLLFKSGDRSFAIPTEQVVMTSLWEDLDTVKTDRSEVNYAWDVTSEEITTPGLDLREFWNPLVSDRSISEHAIAIQVRLNPNDPGLWLLADKLLGKLELKIQPLPAPLVAPQGLMGVSLQADSSLMPVLELDSLQDLINSKPNANFNFNSANSKVEFSKTTLTCSSTILIVDDAALIRRRIGSSLAAYGYETHSCVDGLEAWKWLQKNPLPALMLTDIEMPNLDGFSLIDRCRQRDWHFPIIVVSSRLAEEWSQESKRIGGDDFLTKGFSTQELISKVQEYYQYSVIE